MSGPVPKVSVSTPPRKSLIQLSCVATPGSRSVALKSMQTVPPGGTTIVLPTVRPPVKFIGPEIVGRLLAPGKLGKHRISKSLRTLPIFTPLRYSDTRIAIVAFTTDPGGIRLSKPVSGSRFTCQLLPSGQAILYPKL